MLNLIRNYFARRRIKGMFGRQVSRASVDRMVASGRKPVLDSSEVELTPFFSSIHSYVGLAELMPLPLLGELLNAYFDACVTAIQEQGGTIDKFIGDAIVAMFGVPLPTPDHALRACVAALRCQTRVSELRERLRQEGNRWPPLVQYLRMRIGLHTGKAIVGNLGTKTRFNFTMMGDNVNLAARMESGAKSYGVWTLCTDATQRACEKADAGRIVFRPLGPIMVKGRTGLVELFEPVAFREDVSDQLRECISVFEAGLGRWRDRDWDGAIQHFEKSARLERNQPGTSPEIKINPSTLYLNMARSNRANPKEGPQFV
jgi:adenylate cyclase